MSLAQSPAQVSDALNVASQFTFWAGFLFPPVTALFWPWWRSVWGWNIITLETWIWLSLLPAPLHAYFGVSYDSFLMWFQVAAVAGAGLTVAWRGILIYLTQRAAARRPPADS
jgi:hypothetical protein